MIIEVTLIIKPIQLLALGALVVSFPGCGGLGPPAPAPPPKHVFVIVMENKSPQEALSGSVTASLAAKDLGDQLTQARVSWRAYMEGLGSAGCLDSPVPYDPGHNPFAYYGGRCPANVVPFTTFAADLHGNTPLFSWITPDMCHDEHSCDVSVGDGWLRQTVGMITGSTAWVWGGVLFVVSD